MKRLIILSLLFALSHLAAPASEQGECFVILIEKADIPKQWYEFLDTRLSGDYFKKEWGAGKYIMAAKNTRTGWFTVLRQPIGDENQSYVYNSFKEVKKTCEANIKKGLYVSGLSLGEVGTRWLWWGVFNTKPGVTRQVVDMVGCKQLPKWMEQQAEQGLKLTTCSRKFGDCAVVAQDGTDIDKQQICFYENANNALADIQVKWKEGWRVGVIDVSMTNKYLIVYNTYTKPREGEQYVAYCDSRESAEAFIHKRCNNGYRITQVGGAYYPGAVDENGNKVSFVEIFGGLLTTSAQLYTDIKGGNKGGNGTNATSGSDEDANTGSCRTQQDYQNEYDKWAAKAEHAAMKWYKNGKIDSQNSKQGQITAGERKILQGYQKLMRNVADGASKKGFSIKRSDIEDFNP